MTAPRIQWAKSPAFAEAAEALGIRSDQVAALIAEAEAVGVLWSTDSDPGDAQYSRLERDADGILRLATARTLPGYFADLFRRLDEFA